MRANTYVAHPAFVGKKTLRLLVGVTVGAMLALFTLVPTHAATIATNSSTNTDLGDLFILDQLFMGNENGTGLFGSDSRFGELIILTEVLGNDGLFSNNNVFNGTGTSQTDLGNLFVLDQVFNRTDSTDGDSGLFGSGDSGLGKLIILSGIVNNTGDTVTVVVEPGDTLSAIAREFNTTVSAIVSMNNISNPNVISVGQRIQVPVGNGNTMDTQTDLGKLLVLDALFSNGSNGLLGAGGEGTGSRLGELIILSKLFGNGGFNGGLNLDLNL